MDIKTLSDEDLDSLLNIIKAEIENRRVSAEAPALIQQAAIKALALGASPANLQQALNKVLDVPVEDVPEEPVVAPDPEATGGTS